MELKAVGKRMQDTDEIHHAIFSFLWNSKSLKSGRTVRILALLGMLCLTRPMLSQSQLQPLPALPSFPLQSPQNSLSIQREAVPSRPFSVVGPRGAVLGQQDGSCELWLFPWKILSDLHISAQMDNYAVPIDVNQHAAGIEVRP